MLNCNWQIKHNGPARLWRGLDVSKGWVYLRSKDPTLNVVPSMVANTV